MSIIHALDELCDQPLALTGGPQAVSEPAPASLFHWPIVTEEDESAVLEVMRRGAMSGTDVTVQFEREFADWHGMPYALGTCNGTAAILASMWACEVGAGTEVICPSMTYWASAAPALQLGAAVNFADILPDTLCIDPADIEHRIGPRTKAIVVVHYTGYPCDMDAIMEIARRHNVKVIEDNSHAQGSLYKGRLTGTLGDISPMSLMAGKSFAVGEAGILLTRDETLFQRAVAFGHYERMSDWAPGGGVITDPELAKYKGAPIGGVKHRMNQTCSAMGRVQLKHYQRRIEEIQAGMNRFWDLLEGTPGLRAHRPPADSGSTMGGWYAPKGLYRGEELGGLSCADFCAAVRAEGAGASAGSNGALHLHPLFNECDIFRQGKPTSIAFGQRDVRQGPGTLPKSEGNQENCYSIPWFKHDDAAWIERYAAAYRKVALQAASVKKHFAEAN